MRRTLSPELYVQPKATRPTEPSLLDVELPLECITPVIGGGVESFEPDEVDVVRVPSLRGQLRYWWRACQPQWPMTGEERRMPGVEALFLHEARTWGAVGVNELRSKSQSEPTEAAWKSRVRISVQVTNRGNVIPAGVHEIGPNGQIRALPKWTLGERSLGYALFPLQQPREELEGNTRPVPTRSVREGLTFTLRLQLARLTNDQREYRQDLGIRHDVYDEKAECNQLLAALWAFVHLGGIGARTRRGFGAMAPGRLNIKHAPEGFAPWEKLFAAPEPPELATWLSQFYRAVDLHLDSLGGRGPAEWPVLHGASFGAGPPQRRGIEAQAWLLEELHRFRQGPGVGRNPGQQQGRPGRSRWPEPDWLKRLADDEAKRKGKSPHRWAHPPAPIAARPDDAIAPRAAFGMPIVVSFKDAGDKEANAQIVPTPAGGRWTSPLILRPIRCAGNQYVPMAIAFDRRPGHGSLRDMTVYAIQNPAHPMRVAGYIGAQSPIKENLGKRDAVDAYFEYLAQRQVGFQRISLHRPKKG